MSTSSPQKPNGTEQKPRFTRDQLDRLENLIENVVTSRSQFFKQLFDPRRNIDDECGYPPSSDPLISPEMYQQLYEREPIAARVVEVLPKECWQVQPLVYEDEDSDNVTEFEEAWDGLGSQLRGESSHYKEEKGSPVWEYLKRADILSGIGQFALIFLGIDDGMPLDTPLEGVDTLPNYGGVSQMTPRGSEDQYHQGSVLLPDRGYFTPSSPFPGMSPQGEDNGNGSGGNYRILPQRTYDESDSLSNLPGMGRTGQGEKDKRSSGNGDAEDKPDTFGKDTSKTKSRKRKLLYIRVFPESQVQITQYEANPLSPRYGQPLLYNITFNDPRIQQGGIGLTVATRAVHWTRVIHIADVDHQATSSEVFGVPRMRPVLNPLLDIRKIRGASGEGYYKGSFPGISYETQPTLGGDVDVDTDELRDMHEAYSNGLQRALFLMGITAKTLAPTVTDPTSQLAIHLQAICIKIGCPQRIFMGTERGELASSQDDSAWNDRLKERQHSYITPRVIVPFIDRLIACGVLPKPNYIKPELPDGPQPPSVYVPQGNPNPNPIPGEDETQVQGSGTFGGGKGEYQGEGENTQQGVSGESEGIDIETDGKGVYDSPNGSHISRIPQRQSQPQTGQGLTQEGDTNDIGTPQTVRPSRSPESGGIPKDRLNQSIREDGVGSESAREKGLTPSGTSTPDTVDGGIPIQPGEQPTTTPDQGQVGEIGGGTLTPQKPLIPPKRKPKPKVGYCIEWPDLTSQSDQEKATVANTYTTAISAYVSGGCEVVIPLFDFLTRIMKFDEEEAKAIVQGAEAEQQKQKLQQQQDEQRQLALGTHPSQQPVAPNPFGGPPKPPNPNGPPKPPSGMTPPKPPSTTPKPPVTLGAKPPFPRF